MIYHVMAFVAGYIIDLIIGDPYWLPHPIRLIGRVIGVIEKNLNSERHNRALVNGMFL